MTEIEKALSLLQEALAPMSETDNESIALEDIQATHSLEVDIASSCSPVTTAEGVAELLQLPISTVRALCRSGQLKAFKVGKLWRIPRVELIAFIQGGGCND